MTIKDLKPTELWNYFYEITQIPRASKEEKILAYLLDFCKKHNLEAYKTKQVISLLQRSNKRKRKHSYHYPTIACRHGV